MQPITKWYWQAQTTAAIPETVRRGIKFAATPPGGPVFLAVPDQHAARARRTAADHGPGKVRRADAHPPRPRTISRRSRGC